jgi:hypothetical protein
VLDLELQVSKKSTAMAVVLPARDEHKAVLYLLGDNTKANCSANNSLYSG